MTTLRLALVWTLCSALAGCIALPTDVSTDARIGCTSVDDCPQGWICRERIRECRSPEGLDETPPELVDVSLSPALAQQGTEVVLSFAASEPLFEAPEVTANGRPFTSSSTADGGPTDTGDDGRYHYTYVADGTEPQGTAVDVVVSLLDVNGMGNMPVAGALTFDFDAPEVTTDIALEPGDGWLAAGETLRISFSLSETLPEALAPLVTLSASDGTLLLPTLESQNGASYVYVYTPVGDEAEVTYGVAIDLEDEAGNLSSSSGPRVTFDFTPPAIDNVFLRYTPDANNSIPSAFLAAAKTGTDITLRITATEPLDEAAVAMGALELTGILPQPSFGPRLPLSALAPPPIMNGPPGITATADDNRVLIEGTFNDASPTGVYFLEVTWSDLAGNTTTVSLEDPDVAAPDDRAIVILIRNETPLLDVKQEQVRVVFAPWGTRGPSAATEGPGDVDDVRELLGVDMIERNGGSQEPYEVRLPSGPHVAITPDDPLAVQAGIAADTFTLVPRAGDLLAQFDVDPVVQLVVYVDEDGPEVGRMGRLSYLPGVSDDRWLRTELPFLPFERLYVAGIDLAGNESARVPLQQAQWVAHPGESAFLGQRAEAALSARATAGLTPRLDESTLIAAPPDPRDSTVWDDTLPQARLGAAFRELPWAPSTPLPRFGGAVAYDAVRDNLVLFGDEAVGTDTSDTWTFDGRVWKDATPAGLNPSPRIYPGLAFDAARGRTVMFGGTVLGAVNPEDQWEWDGEGWTPVDIDHSDARPEGRFGHTLVFDPVGERVLLLGGINVEGAGGCPAGGPPGYFCDLWAWDGTAWTTLTTTGDDPGPRVFAGAAVDPLRGVLVLWRGSPGVELQDDVNDTWELDLNTLVWTRFDLPDATPLAPIQTGFFHPREGRVASVAARTPAVGDPRWEVVTWSGSTWASVGVVPTDDQPDLDRLLASVAYLPSDDHIFLAGGLQFEGSPPLSDFPITYLLDPDRGWRALDPTPGDIFPARNLATLTWDAQRGVAVLSGGGEWVPNGFATDNPLFDDLYELVGNRWEERSATPGPRLDGIAAFVPNTDEVVFFGGTESITVVDSMVEDAVFGDASVTWDGTTLTSLTPAERPAARAGQAAATAPTGGVLAFGGLGVGGLYNDLWAFDGADWVSVAVNGPSPSPRTSAAMVLDEARNEVVMMGGYVFEGGDFAASDETWVFDGSSWEDRTGPGPGPLGYHKMVFDTERQRVLLFGGLNDAVNGDVWEWDGNAWEITGDVVPPLYRFGHGLAYDRDLGRTLVAAGMSPNFIFQSTTFERVSPSDHDVPAITFIAPATLTSFARDAITAVTARARCSGVSDGGGGTEAYGAQLLIWDPASHAPGLGAWRPVASTSSGPGEPLALMSVREEGAVAQRLFVERDRALALQCRPTGPSGEVVGRVASSFVEIRVDYDLP